MPCDSSHMQASRIEVELSRVYQLLDELDGIPIRRAAWDGYDERAYNHATREKLDEMTRLLCAKLTARGDVGGYSLELQLWWREHQRADAARVLRETADAERQQLRSAGLAKLTGSEAAALGLEK